MVVSDRDNKERNQEREIYKKTYEVLEKNFLNNIKIKFTNNIDSLLDGINKTKILFIEKKNLKKLNNLANSDIKNKFKLNVLVLGKTGVGKSQLINRILEFDKAPVSDKIDPCLIDIWPKKYPENENDSKIKWINLFDTEGIECGKDNGNDLENHFKKLEDYFKKNVIDLDKQINMIWYCVHGNKLEKAEKDYIKNIIDVYKNKCKIPIIFIYTQAYKTEGNNIENMENSLKELYNNKDFKFIDIISKEYKYINRRTKKEETEEELNINELKNQSIELSKNSINFSITQKLNFEIFLNESENAKNILNSMQIIFMELIIEVYKSPEDSVIKILEKTKNNFQNLIEIFYKEMYLNDDSRIELKIIINNIGKIIMEFETTLQKLADEFDYEKDVLEILDDFITKKYKEKLKQKQKLKDFKSDVIDYIVKPLCSPAEKHAVAAFYKYLLSQIFQKYVKNYSDWLYEFPKTTKETFVKIYEETLKNFTEKVNVNE